MREIEAVRDRIMAMCASPMPVIEAGMEEFESLGNRVTRQWRKPLSIEEVAQMAPTPDVRERRGRP